MGDGARKQKLKDDAARRGLKNVTFVDSVSEDENTLDIGHCLMFL